METEAEYKVSPKPIHIDKVLEKINEIAKESATGDYIYRGEPEHYDKVSSSLYREYHDIEAEHFDIAVVQKDILREAREYAPHKMEDFELLATLQHFGDKTNLIDFTTDYLIALFFACDRNIEKPGKVILLRRESESGSETYKAEKPPRTIRRAEAQKSIFVQAPKGFVEPDRIVTIPVHLKAALLNYLRNHHDISTKTIYNDLQGFIEKRGLHKNTYTEFYKGVTSQDRADSAKTEAERQKCYDDAITHYTEAIDLNSELTEAYYNRGNAYVGKSDFEAAIEDFTKAIDLAPKDASVYYNRGLAYRNTRNFEAAIEDFNKAIDLDSENARFYNGRGNAYTGKGDFEAAIEDYSKAIDLAPEDAGVYSNRGLAYFRTDDFEAAIEDFTKAMDLAPKDAYVCSNRGVAYLHKGDFDAAIQDYNEAIELSPETADFYSNRGEAWLHLKEWQKAKADLTTAKDKGCDITESFHNDYKSVEDFEAKNGVTLPKDIAALLSGNKVNHTRQKRNEQYWAAFFEALPSDKLGIEIPSIYDSHYRDLHMGITGCYIRVSQRVRPAGIAAAFVMKGSAQNFCHSLIKQQTEIENELGEKFYCYEAVQGEKQLYVALKSCDVTDKTDWSDQHQWFAMKLEKLIEVFRPRIEKLI